MDSYKSVQLKIETLNSEKLMPDQVPVAHSIGNQDPSHGLYLSHWEDYTPSIVLEVLGGPYDVLSTPIPYGELMTGRHRVSYGAALTAIMSLAYRIHEPAKLVVVTCDDRDKHPKAVFDYFCAMNNRAAQSVNLPFTPMAIHLHIGDGRVSEDGVNRIKFPRRHTKVGICHCLDPRCVQHRLENEERHRDAAYFSFPGVLSGILRKSEGSKHMRRLMIDSLKRVFASGTQQLIQCVHEDCRADPIAGEHDTPEGYNMAMDRRIGKAKRAHDRISQIFGARTVGSFSAEPIVFGGRQLHVRRRSALSAVTTTVAV